MRCQCCNTTLNDYESTMRHAITKQFVNTCSQCLSAMGDVIPLQVRNDLLSESDTGNVDTLFNDVEDYVEDSSEDDAMNEYWNER